MSAVIVRNLVKRYGALTAIDRIDFKVSAGTCFGSLGPNGAGKTTLIRILTGLINATAGYAEVAGCDVTKRPDRVRSHIGVVSQAMTTDLDLTGWENLDIYARYYGVPLKERKNRIADLLDRVGLRSRARDLVASYSGGMRRRLEIARGLIHRPKILFLDEPTIGLDPQSRRVVWDLLKQFRQDERLTIFLTTHYMDEADFLCDRIAIIDMGKIMVMDSPEGLKNSIPGNNVLEIAIPGDQVLPEGESYETIASDLSSLPFVEKVVPSDALGTLDSHPLQVSVSNGSEAIPLVMKRLHAQGILVQSIGLMRPSLEDVFIHYTGRSIRSEEGQKVNFFIGAGVPRRMGG
ncbi:MAG: ATP-binding cassette domain-containing protein [Nitrospiria bacterium]